MRVIQQPRVCVAEESLGAMDIAPLDCPDKPGNDGGEGWVLSRELRKKAGPRLKAGEDLVKD
jgi:hypothetical protein